MEEEKEKGKNDSRWMLPEQKKKQRHDQYGGHTEYGLRVIEEEERGGERRRRRRKAERRRRREED